MTPQELYRRSVWMVAMGVILCLASVCITVFVTNLFLRFVSVVCLAVNSFYLIENARSFIGARKTLKIMERK